MSLIDMDLNYEPSWEFEAHIQVMQHATSIKCGYNAVAHVGGIIQAAEILDMKDPNGEEIELLRAGNVAIVRFRFLYHAELIKANTPILFREGNCMINGWIREVYKEVRDEDEE